MHTPSFTGAKVFDGAIKQTPEDFIVEEISSSGRVSVAEKGYYHKALGKLKLKGKRKKYLIFDAQKRGISTFCLCDKVAKLFGVHHDKVSYSGLKDDVAITCQQICVEDPKTLDVQLSNGDFFIKSPKWAEKKLSIGKLRGNRFHIVIRNISESPKCVLPAMEKFAKLSSEGFPNYYGPQRFGEGREVANKVGKYFMDKKYKRAMLTYLTTPSKTEGTALSAARIDLKRALSNGTKLKRFPKEGFIENLMIRALENNKRNYETAFMALPNDIKYFFICSYESQLFNSMISKRIKTLKKSANKPHKGDVLIKGIPSTLMVGTKSKFSSGPQGRIEKQVMKKERISFEDFLLPHAKGIKCYGKRRQIFSIPQDVKVISVCSDKYNLGKTAATISFSLDTGCYATTFLGQIIAGLLEVVE